VARRLKTRLNDPVPDEPDPGVYIEETTGAKPIEGVETLSPPGEPSYPGVYVEETSPGAKPIPGVDTSAGSGGRVGFLSAAKTFALRRWRRSPSP
jgi:hypothetical protein